MASSPSIATQPTNVRSYSIVPRIDLLTGSVASITNTSGASPLSSGASTLTGYAAAFVVPAAPPVIIAVVIAELIRGFINWGVRQLLDAMFGKDNDQSSLLANIASLMSQMCEYVCTFVYASIEEARVKTMLSTAKTALIAVQNQLALSPEKPKEVYETLIANGMLSQALAAYSVAADDAAEVAVVNYATIATVEIKLVQELIALQSKLVDVNSLNRVIANHTQTVTSLLAALTASVKRTYRVGVTCNSQWDCPPISPAATVSADEPNSPETWNYNATPCGVRYLQRYYVELYLQHRNPWVTGGWETDVKHQEILDGSQGRPPFNQQLRDGQNLLPFFRSLQKNNVDGLLAHLEETTTRPLKELTDVWAKAVVK